MRFRRRFETRLAVRKEGGGVIRAGYPPLNGLYLGDKRRAESGLKAGWRRVGGGLNALKWEASPADFLTVSIPAGRPTISGSITPHHQRLLLISFRPSGTIRSHPEAICRPRLIKWQGVAESTLTDSHRLWSRLAADFRTLAAAARVSGRRSGRRSMSQAAAGRRC